MNAVENRTWVRMDRMHKHPEVAALTKRIEAVEAESRQLDRLLAMDRQDRFNADPARYEQCQNQVYEGFRAGAMWVAVAGLAAGVAAAYAAMAIPGIPQQVGGLIALATAAVTFVKPIATRVSPMAAYAAICKKWVLPRKADALMLQDLRGQKRLADHELRQLQQNREAVSQRVLKELEQEPPPPPEALPSLDVEEEQVVFNGVALPRRRS